MIGKCVTKSKTDTSAKMRRNNKKAKRRKEARLEQRMKNILSLVGAKDDNSNPCVSKLENSSAFFIFKPPKKI